MRVGILHIRSSWVAPPFLLLLLLSQHIYVLGNKSPSNSQSLNSIEKGHGASGGVHFKDSKGILTEEEMERLRNLTVANVIDDLNLDDSNMNPQINSEAQNSVLRQFLSNLEEKIIEEKACLKYKEFMLEERIIEINNTISLRKKELAELDYRIKSVYMKAVDSIEKLQQSYMGLIKKNEETLFILKKILFDSNGPEFKVKGYFKNLPIEYSKLNDICINFIITKLRYDKIIIKVEDMTRDEIENLAQDVFELISKFSEYESNNEEWTFELMNVSNKFQRFYKITSLQKTLAESVESDRLHVKFDFDKYTNEIISMNYYLRHQIELLNFRASDLKEQIVKQEIFKKEIDTEINDKKGVIDLIREILERELRISKFFIAKLNSEIKQIDIVLKTRGATNTSGGKK